MKIRGKRIMCNFIFIILCTYVLVMTLSAEFVELVDGTSDNSIDTSGHNWVTVNYDIQGTRNNNQTMINSETIDLLEMKWQIPTELEIHEPPIVIDNRGYVQDYAGNVFAFDTESGNIIWHESIGSGPTMGLTYNNGTIFASTGASGSITTIDPEDGEIIWESEVLGDTSKGYRIDSFPIVWNDYVIAGSAGSGPPSEEGVLRGTITALNRTDGSILWDLETTTGEWVKKDNNTNGGATAWSGGSLDPETGLLYIPLGSAAPNFNASTRQTPNLYSNHMVAVNITSGELIWATPFIAHGTVLDNLDVPDTHDWDTSWGSSVSRVLFPDGTQKKVVVGHDKMGNVIAMDGNTGEEIWWKTLGNPTNINSIPMPNGSGMIWAHGVYNYHAVDADTLYVTATNRGLNFFTDGLEGEMKAPQDTIKQGLKNGTIYALDLITGSTKWKLDIGFPPRVSPIVTSDLLITGYLPFNEDSRSGIILALNKKTGEILREIDVNAPIGPVGPSIRNDMLFVPTGELLTDDDQSEVEDAEGSVIAFQIGSP
jgi:outer membrane protein assembly factor BamB